MNDKTKDLVEKIKQSRISSVSSIETEKVGGHIPISLSPNIVVRFNLRGETFRVFIEKGKLCLLKITAHDPEKNINIEPLGRNKFLIS